MNDNKPKQTRSVINGAPIAAAAGRPVVRPAVSPTAGASVRPVASAKPVAKPNTASGDRPTNVAVGTSNVHAQTQAQMSGSSVQHHIAGGQSGASSAKDSAKTTSTVKQTKKTSSKSKNNKKMWISICCAVLAIAAVVAIVMLALNGKKDDQGDSVQSDGAVDTNGAIIDADSEEVKRTTQDTINKYAEVVVEGYKDVEGEGASGKAVVITVKNISEETVSLAITMGAYDAEGNLLDTSSMYAEGIQPGQTSLFNTFVFSELTPEQLGSATYKVYTANTYEAPTPEGEDGVETEKKEESEEVIENEANR